MKILGFDIGGTKCAAVLADYRDGVLSDILERYEIPTTKNPQDTVSALCSMSKVWLRKENLCAGDMKVGISCGGPLDGNKGIIINPPNLPGWEGFGICEFVTTALGCPAKLKNDADACCIAEWRIGAAKGYRNVIFLTFGTGLGAGLILDNRPYSGSIGLAGEVGHIRIADKGPLAYGKNGSFESFCSGAGIRLLAIEYAREKAAQGKTIGFAACEKDLESLSTKKLGEYAERGDADALEVFKMSGRMFGKGLSILIDILNPDIIVAGSVYARCHKWMDGEMRKIIQEESLSASAGHCVIVPSLLDKKIGDYGALFAAVY